MGLTDIISNARNYLVSNRRNIVYGGLLLASGIALATIGRAGCGDGYEGTRIRIPRAAEIAVRQLPESDSPEKYAFLKNWNGRKVEAIRGVIISPDNPVKVNMLLWERRGTRYVCVDDVTDDDKAEGHVVDTYAWEGRIGQGHETDPGKEIDALYQEMTDGAFAHARNMGKMANP